jgi:hypothetical protein
MSLHPLNQGRRRVREEGVKSLLLTNGILRVICNDENVLELSLYLGYGNYECTNLL